MGTTYFPFIDGLRALAVVAVIVHHFEASLIASGHLGVDIFFVISGFVITASLMAQRARSLGTFLRDFYGRRVKRLLPALFACVAVTGIALSLVVPEPRSYLATGLYALAGVSNIALYRRATDYWGEAARLDPFTHTWSLGVEEQFYLLFPALVWWLAVRGGGGPGDRERLIFACGAIVVVSLAAYIAVGLVAPMATFYLPAFRFWQLGLGALAALAVAGGHALPSSLTGRVAQAVTLIGIVGLLLTPDGWDPWTNIGITALTALAILQGVERGDRLRLLTTAPMLYIGRISYSLYLWHWPVIVLSVWTIGIEWWSWPWQALLIGVLAAASYHGIERPLRHARWAGRPAALGVLAALAALWLPVLGVGLWQQGAKGGPSLFVGTRPANADGQFADLPCARPHDGRLRTMRTIGNSHALHILPMLEPIARACGFRLLHNRPGSEIDYPRGQGVDGALAERALADIGAGGILILSSRYNLLYQVPYLDGRGETWLGPIDEAQVAHRQRAVDIWLAEFDDLVARAAARGVDIVFMRPNVEFDTPLSGLPQEVCSEQWYRIVAPACRVSVARKALDQRFPVRWLAAIDARAAAAANVHVFDPLPVTCPAGDRCWRQVGGIDAFRDVHHLSGEGARLMVMPFTDFLLERGLVERVPR
ncbi:MAG: acyltransferase family protein [Hyphomicrobiaceae bacterium]|nr:acyltransferase family protein [Hyphomicrobiaceae bacterium]